MKPVNKLIRLFAVALVICMMLAVTANAAQAGHAWYYLTGSENGDTVVSIAADTAVTDGLVKLTYDPETLTYKGISFNSNCVAMHAVNAEEPGVVLISWVAPGEYTVTDGQALLLTVEFTGEAEEITVTGEFHDADGTAMALATVDTASLEAAVDAAKALEEKDYTAESWKAVEEALKAAEAVLADPTRTPAEVEAAAAALEAAVEALEEYVVDTTELEKAIAKAKALDKKDYSTKSYEAVKSALAVAEKVMAKEDKTQEEVDAAAKALNDAIKALVPSTGKNPGTGDEANLGLAAAAAGLAVLGIVILLVLNHKNKKKGR